MKVAMAYANKGEVRPKAFSLGVFIQTQPAMTFLSRSTAGAESGLPLVRV